MITKFATWSAELANGRLTRPRRPCRTAVTPTVTAQTTIRVMPGYLSFRHVSGDLITFASGEAIWLAPDRGGQAWRLLDGRVAANNPRLSGDGELVAWTGRSGDVAEVYLAELRGGPCRRRTARDE